MNALPIDPLLPLVTDALRRKRSVIVVAAPGAGKTTRIPPAIAGAIDLVPADKSILVLQPRRVAARAAAARMADEQGWKLGEQVGYQVRFENRTCSTTRIRVLTEGILTRRIQSDPFLENVGCVILDEFHERSIHVDLALALLQEIRTTVRPDLRIVVMSATMDPAPVANFLGDAEILESAGQMHPVDITYLNQPNQLPVWEKAAVAVRDACKTTPASGTGHVLVFLPGISEIRKTEDLIGNVDAQVHVLHSSISSEDQDRALRPSPRRKVILATNIAETSLTIDGVTTVIDGGLARIASFDARLGLEKLELKRISKASAQQRAGRAGRTAAGTCMRLWSHAEQAAMEEYEIPEIRRTDLAAPLLALFCYGVRDPAEFAWYAPPSKSDLDGAVRLLTFLGAIDGQKRITPLGKQLSLLPVHPRLGRLLVAGAEAGLQDEATLLAALLSEGDVLFGSRRRQKEYAPQDADSDLLAIMDAFAAPRGTQTDPQARQRIQQLSRQLLQLLPKVSAWVPSSSRPRRETLLKLVLHAYPDRVTLRRQNDSTRGVMVGGRGIILDESSVVRSAKLFISIDAWEQTTLARTRDASQKSITECRVSIASAIEQEWLDELYPGLVEKKVQQQFDVERNKVVSVRRICFTDLILSEEVSGIKEITHETPGDSPLYQHLREIPGAEVYLKSFVEVNQWIARYQLLAKAMPELNLDLMDADVFDTILAGVCTGVASPTQIRESKVVGLFESRLNYKQRAAINEHAPVSLQLPSGEKHRIDYAVAVQAGNSGSPVIAVRLQELFGLPETPRIARGRIPLLLHLLGPNYRPVQVTSDLHSFWTNVYPEVRKELRARYPKHPWPEDPWNAPAVSVGRRRRQ